MTSQATKPSTQSRHSKAGSKDQRIDSSNGGGKSRLRQKTSPEIGMISRKKKPEPPKKAPTDPGDQNEPQDSTAAPTRHALYAFDTLGLEELWEKSVAYTSASDMSDGSDSESESDALSGIIPPVENSEVWDGGIADGGGEYDTFEKPPGHSPCGGYLPLEEYLVTGHRHEQFWSTK